MAGHWSGKHAAATTTPALQDLGLLPEAVNPQLVSPQELISVTGDLEGHAKYEEFWEDKIYVVNPVDVENIPRKTPQIMEPPTVEGMLNRQEENGEKEGEKGDKTGADGGE